MELSTRIRTMAGSVSGAWDIFFRARALAEAGKTIVELTIGEHDERTDPAILDAMYNAARAGHTGYAAMPGTDALRDAVADRVTRQTGVPTARRNVLITAGGQFALFCAHHAVLDEGDTALMVEPFYATYPGVIRSVGGRPRTVAARPEDDFQPRADAIDAAVTAAADDGAPAKSLLINSPNNPTGTVYGPATLGALADVCKARDLWLISDEVYETQVWDGTHLSPRALPGMAERTMVVGSVSKTFAMTGSRCGWLVAPEEAIAHMIELTTQTTYGVAGFVQDAALYALQAGPEFEARIAAPFHRRRDLALKVLDGQNTVTAVPPLGAMYVMLDIRQTGLSGIDFANRLLDRHGIAVMPGESFGPAAAGHVRIALTVADDLLEASLRTLCTFAADPDS
ncbi:pyridoxal phosphate-dependent aminotransferase [Chachezhania sediminis]|uniref:pyridoxal phosphate-dependent aminotransferase n=1 Tax=Chachezhania sediminis TaxID=2599291 RepID=UPI00131E72F3|nr:pyridoxal phosphate-dependent aminotransferase [Chachezhania sediminis]